MVSSAGDPSTVLELTGQMLDAALANDWERVIEVESQRRPYLETAFGDAPGSAEEYQVWKMAAEKVMELDARIARMASEQRSAVGSDLAQMLKGKEVAAAYKSND